jgi:hypothetical protein
LRQAAFFSSLVVTAVSTSAVLVPASQQFVAPGSSNFRLARVMAAGEHGRCWPLVVGGIVGLVIGALTFVQPAATALALVYVIGAWAIVTGVFRNHRSNSPPPKS